LEDILKFDKVQAYVAENNLDQKFRKQKFKWSIWLYWKERNNADKLTRLEDVKIPADFDYDKIKSMSIEAKN
jgi:tRNA uridine 5-carboxymethylaminomethyl modification enzyme